MLTNWSSVSLALTPWWRHQMETSAALLGLCAGTEFTGHRWIPPQRPVTRSFVVFFDPCLNKRLSSQSWGWWYETPSCSLWCHCSVTVTSQSWCGSTVVLPVRCVRYVPRRGPGGHGEGRRRHRQLQGWHCGLPVDRSVRGLFQWRHNTWWHHQMETFSPLLALGEGNLPATGEFSSQGQWRVTKASEAELGCFLSIGAWLNGWSKQSWGWWFETSSHSSWRHCNEWPMDCPHKLITIICKSINMIPVLSSVNQFVGFLIWSTNMIQNCKLPYTTGKSKQRRIPAKLCCKFLTGQFLLVPGHLLILSQYQLFTNVSFATWYPIWLFVQRRVQANSKWNTKAPFYSPLVVESIVHPWTSLTKDQ